MIDLPRIFLANVGVNASHEGKGLKSPRFADGSFEFVTIPERQYIQKNLAQISQPQNLIRYADLKCFNWPNKPLTDFLPPKTHQIITHYDPEFNKFTYGDEGGNGGRATALKKLRQGDLLFFLARLTDYDIYTNTYFKNAAFYLIGFLEIEEVLTDVRSALDLDTLANFGHNAHFRRASSFPSVFYDGFYIFKGSKRSRRFKEACFFGRNEAEKLLRDSNGQQWFWNTQRTDLQIIGSYTRTCRCVLDPDLDAVQAERVQSWLELTNAFSN